MSEITNTFVNQERRKHRRARIKWPVTIKTKQGVLAGKTKNIGAGGALVYYDQPLSYDQPLREHESFIISMKALNRFPLSIQVEVIWYDILSSDERSIVYGMGLRFTGISEKDRQLLIQAVSYQLEVIGGWQEEIFPSYITVDKGDGTKPGQAPILEARWPVTIETTGELVEGETKDISAAGVSILYKEPLQPNEIIRVFITPPNHPTLVVSGKPLWYVSYGLEEVSASGSGICYIEVPKHDGQILNEIIEAHFKKKSQQPVNSE